MAKEKEYKAHYALLCAGSFDWIRACSGMVHSVLYAKDHESGYHENLHLVTCEKCLKSKEFTFELLKRL